MTVVTTGRQQRFVNEIETTISRLKEEYENLKGLQMEYTTEADPQAWLRTFLNDPGTQKPYSTTDFETALAQIGAFITWLEAGGANSPLAAFCKVAQG